MQKEAMSKRVFMVAGLITDMDIIRLVIDTGHTVKGNTGKGEKRANDTLGKTA